MTLIVTADSNTCKMYDYQRHPQTLTLIKEITHPENKLKESDLVSDSPGSYQPSATSSRGHYSPVHTTKETHIDRFMQEIIHDLTAIHEQKKYKNCIIMAPSHIEGLLSQHAKNTFKHFTTSVIQKNVAHLSSHELLEFIKTHEAKPL